MLITAARRMKMESNQFFEQTPHEPFESPRSGGREVPEEFTEIERMTIALQIIAFGVLFSTTLEYSPIQTSVSLVAVFQASHASSRCSISGPLRVVSEINFGRDFKVVLRL